MLQNIHGTMQFLQRFPPFNQMENTHLAYLVEQCQLRFYAPGESIIRPTDGPVEHFYIVKQGRVVGERTHEGREEAQTTFEITAGECFPLAALLGERATRTEHRAAEDTFCLQLNKPAFIKLFALSDEFRDFALRGVSSLLDKVNQQVQQKAAQTLGTQYSLNTRLGELAMRHPVTCAPDVALREAVRLMHEQQVGSIVVVDEHKAPLGIFTLRDLRQVVANGIEDFAQAIDQHMTPEPFYLSPDHSAFDAAIAMTERHIAHVCLVKDQRLCGVVSERDLFSLQRVDLASDRRNRRGLHLDWRHDQGCEGGGSVDAAQYLSRCKLQAARARGDTCSLKPAVASKPPDCSSRNTLPTRHPAPRPPLCARPTARLRTLRVSRCT